MARYLVVNPWVGGPSAGEVVEIETLHPSLASHVQKLPKELEVSTPEPAKPVRGKVLK